MVKKKTDLHKKDPMKLLHPNSRKAVKLSKATNRQDKMLRAKVSGNPKLNARAQLLCWVKSFLDDYPDPFTATDFLDLLDCYLHRHDDELEEIDERNCIGGYRKGRHSVSRESALKDQLEREKREFDGCGLEFPDLLSKKIVAFLRQWDGDAKTIHNVRMKPVKRKLLEALSARDPPRSDEGKDDDQWVDASDEDEPVDTS